ncbi:MAG: DUF1800 domain-containing protein [Gemmatimonadaceae bacterium]|nr:DUF1800 domain-containing protein [Gemmatimonadaceae bacterium]
MSPAFKRTALTLLLLSAPVYRAAPQTATAMGRASASGRLDHRELAADQQVIHVLNRLTFGARPGDAQKVRVLGVDRWVAEQLNPERIDDASLQRFLAGYSVFNQNQEDLLQQYAEAQQDRRSMKRADAADQVTPDDSVAMRQLGMRRTAAVSQLQSARLARAVVSNRQLEEVMIDFWLNHFNVFIGKGPPQAYYIVDYERSAIRPHSLGNFRDLLGAVAKSPAMLFYLDNARSMADSTRPRLENPDRRRGRRAAKPRGGLNENYGRELLELHTLGVDGGYTQQDVIGVARALTGWTINPPATGGGFVFRPVMHDAGEKIVLGRRLAAGRGIQDGEDVLDIVARHPATARHIATKLARRFVSDNPPPALVDYAASVFTRTDGNIREVVRAIVTSNEFFSRQAFRSKVKSPFEVVVSALRALNAQPDATRRSAQAVAYLGQPIYGHQAPNGYPETGESWMNAGGILNRINFGMAVAANRIPGARIDAIPGLDSLANAGRARQVDAVVAMLLNGSASADTRAILMSGENPLARRDEGVEIPTEASGNASTRDGSMMQDGGRRPRNGARRQRANLLGKKTAPSAKSAKSLLPLDRLPQLGGIAQVVGLALGSPEFQRR